MYERKLKKAEKLSGLLKSQLRKIIIPFVLLEELTAYQLSLVMITMSEFLVEIQKKCEEEILEKGYIINSEKNEIFKLYRCP